MVTPLYFFGVETCVARFFHRLNINVGFEGSFKWVGVTRVTNEWGITL